MSSNEEMMDDNLPIVIVGGGIAGVSCAEVLGQETVVKTILISASNLIKVASNLTQSGQTIEQFDVVEQPKSYLEDKYANVEVILAEVIQLSASKHQLRLDEGRIIEYRKLCLCAGARPKLIADNEFVLGIRDIETVANFEKKLTNAKRIVIVGNGGIATELAYEIRNCEVIWAIKDESIGATFFDSGAAKFFLPRLETSPNQASGPSKRLKYTVSPSDSQIKTNFGNALGPDWAQGFAVEGKNKTKQVEVQYCCEYVRIYNSYNVIPEEELTHLASTEPVCKFVSSFECFLMTLKSDLPAAMF